MNSMFLRAASLVLLASLAHAQVASGHNKLLKVKGVVVAVQLDPGAVRSAMDVNSESMGDFAEVWMVRLNRRLPSNGTKYVLVEASLLLAFMNHTL